ncbi:MAG TPA: hypothetical protein VN709_06620 [Terriglobales bacterium]|nr:hypothetical protein [Terriglobales bacterium]
MNHQVAIRLCKTIALATFLSLCTARPVRGQTNTIAKPNRALPAAKSCPSCCTMPVSERTEEEGCYVLANNSLDTLPPGPLYWHLYKYPNIEAASQAKKTSTETVTMSFGTAWLFNIAPSDWRPSSGERVAVIGPLPVPPARRYFARYMESVEASTVTGTPVHTHPGPEAWYLLNGAQCLRTPNKTFVIHAGETGFVPGGEPMVLKPAGTGARHSIVLVLHDASQPWRTKTVAWKPQTQCPE